MFPLNPFSTNLFSLETDNFFMLVSLLCPSTERCPSSYVGHPREKKSLSLSSIFGGNLSRAQSSFDFRSDLQPPNISGTVKLIKGCYIYFFFLSTNSNLENSFNPFGLSFDKCIQKHDGRNKHRKK